MEVFVDYKKEFELLCMAGSTSSGPGWSFTAPSRQLILFRRFSSSSPNTRKDSEVSDE